MVRVDINSEVLNRILERASNCGDDYIYYVENDKIFWNNTRMHCDKPKECGKLEN